MPWLGAALAILGSIVIAIPLCWSVVPIVLGVVFAVAAVKRASGSADNAPAVDEDSARNRRQAVGSSRLTAGPLALGVPAGLRRS